MWIVSWLLLTFIEGIWIIIINLKRICTYNSGIFNICKKKKRKRKRTRKMIISWLESYGFVNFSLCIVSIWKRLSFHCYLRAFFSNLRRNWSFPITLRPLLRHLLFYCLCKIRNYASNDRRWLFYIAAH